MQTIFDSDAIIQVPALTGCQHYPHWARDPFFPEVLPAERSYRMRDIQVKQAATYGSILREIQTDPELSGGAPLLGIADAYAIPAEEFTKINQALYLWRDTVSTHESAFPYVPVLVGYDAKGAPQICWKEVDYHTNATRNILYIPNSSLITE